MIDTPHPDPSTEAIAWLGHLIAHPPAGDLDAEEIRARVDDLSGLDRARLLAPRWGPHLARNPGEIPRALDTEIFALEHRLSERRGTAPIFDGAAADAALPDCPDDLPAWRVFAETAVAEAWAQVRAVQSDALPYTADMLMSPGAARAVGRAMRLALPETLGWGVSAPDEIWRGAAHAPDPRRKPRPPSR